jgi:hypothetical protein
MVGLLALVAGASSAGNEDLVIVHSERWIDTLKGTVKNVSADRAEEIVIVVRYYGTPAAGATVRRPRRAARRQELGQQTAKVGALDPGQETAFEVEIAEQHRGATGYRFEPHAIWRKRAAPRHRRN